MQEQKEKGWWGRNWYWFVPSTCLGCLILPVACVGGCLYMGISQLKSFGPYEEAISIAAADPRVEEALGVPLELDLRGFDGPMSSDMRNDEAEFELPVKGPRGRGILRLEAERRDGEWHYSRLEIEVRDTGETIDLLEAALQIRDAA